MCKVYAVFQIFVTNAEWYITEYKIKYGLTSEIF